MGETTSKQIQRLRGEIVAWRRERYERAPLPGHLWSEAVAIARELGVNRARIALGLSHHGLQSHVDRATAAPEFVEVSGAEVLAAGPNAANGTSIEITGRDVHVVVRLGSGAALDVASLIDVVRGRA